LRAEQRRQPLHGARKYASASTSNPELPLSPIVFLVPGHIPSTPDLQHVRRHRGSRSDLHEVNLRNNFLLYYSTCRLKPLPQNLKFQSEIFKFPF
jgi:hypothetical protein